MKKFINDPFDFVEELTEGIIKAHGDYYRADKGDLRIIVRQDAPIKGKVAIATEEAAAIFRYLWATLARALPMELVSAMFFLLLLRAK